MSKRIKQIKVTLALILILSMVGLHLTPLMPVYAQEVTPLAEPDPASQGTPTPTEVVNTSTTTNTTDTTANTGDNTIGTTPTPTPLAEPDPASQGTPDPSPTPEDTGSTPGVELTSSEDSNLTATNSAEVTNDATSSADSGNNSIESPTPAPTPESSGSESQSSPNSQGNEGTESASINTGDAAAITTVDNSINSTQVNSQVVYQTINLFLDQSGDINLSDPEALVRLITTQNPDSSVINVALTQVTNTAELSNSVNSRANSGNNQINLPEGSASISTGNAYSLISVLNRLNLVMVDSVLHVITINIFGNFNGNIILPEETAANSTSCTNCGASTNVDNSANVTNSVNSQAVSGQNDIVATGSAQIMTGNAASIVQLTNLINTNLVGVTFLRLAILPFGVWDGSFLGWGDVAGSAGGQPLTIAEASGLTSDGCPSCSGDVLTTSSAALNNTISSAANSGGNDVNAANASIQTGNALSLVSLINLVNTNLIRSHGFLGFVNIFGNWHGNIGGASFFAQEDPPPEATTEAPPTENQDNSGPFHREDGGLLTVTNSNNVGSYVLPGDTVTFFLHTRNPGLGRVYDTKLELHLLKDGKDMGGALYNLGDIDAGRGVKVTTGLVLSPHAPGGIYIARATVHGTTGDSQTPVTAFADSTFLIFAPSTLGNAQNTSEIPPAPPAVLGTTQENKTNPNILLALLILFLLVPEYVTLRITRRRDIFRLVLARTSPLMVKLQALRVLLL